MKPKTKLKKKPTPTVRQAPDPKDLAVLSEDADLALHGTEDPDDDRQND